MARRVARLSCCCLLFLQTGEEHGVWLRKDTRRRRTSIWRATTCAVTYGRWLCLYPLAIFLLHFLAAPATAFRSEAGLISISESRRPILRVSTSYNEAHNKLTIRAPNIASVEPIS